MLSMAGLTAFVVSLIIVSTSEINVSSPKKPFSLSNSHDASVITAVLSSVVVSFLGPLAVVSNDFNVAQYSKAVDNP